MIKFGNVTEDSHCDIDLEKKAAFIDEESNLVVSREHVDKLKKPVQISKASEE